VSVARRPAVPLSTGLLLLVTLTGCGSGNSVSAPTTSSVSGSPGAVATVGAAQHLDVSAFQALVGKPDVVVLDVRTPEEFAQGHIMTAVNLDVTAADFGAKVAGLDRTKSYALYCRTGVRSAGALSRLVDAGFAKAVDLKGGIVAWSAAGLPVTTG